MAESQFKIGDWVRQTSEQTWNFQRGKVIAQSRGGRVVYVEWYSSDPDHPERTVFIWPHFDNELELLETEVK